MSCLRIIGGTYVENCIDPSYSELYGSGLRAAIALSTKNLKILFQTSVGSDQFELLKYKSKLYGINTEVLEKSQTVYFDYYHPLSTPNAVNLPTENFKLDKVKAINILQYGMIEADVEIEGEYVVYDPQNHVPFSKTGSSAAHLSIILNMREAQLTLNDYTSDIITLGQKLIVQENAEVVVIKNGSNGAMVIESNEVFEIPVYKTSRVWPIGSGDIFSAVFAYNWIIAKQSAFESALSASAATAQYCETQVLPLKETVMNYKPIMPRLNAKNIYLAGPFFTMAERFLITEIRDLLSSFGNTVFSPFHEIGISDKRYSLEDAKEIATADMTSISNCDTLLAIVSGIDPGTLFEIGYARALNKRVIVLCENEKYDNLLMLYGSDCEITDELSTAIYKASW